MTAGDFKAWRTAMGLSQREAAEALGLSRGTVENYERGTRAQDGKPADVPLAIGLACAALYHRLAPWGR